jgi:hypothetical protein
MGGEKRQIGGAGDVARGARIAPLLPATDGGGTAGAAAHATIRIRASLSDRPVQVIVTSGPGGQGDTTARLLLVLPKSAGRPHEYLIMPLIIYSACSPDAAC